MYSISTQATRAGLGQRGEKRRAEGYLIETTIKLHKSNNYIDGQMLAIF
jgi:hypothetical protein